jgi:hypothetical protein
VILALDLAAREPETTLVSAHGVPSASEMRLAWRQKQLLMAELTGTPEPAPPQKAKVVPPGPRGERTKDTRNT